MIISLLLLGISAGAQTPTQACSKLIDAAKTDNFDAVAGMMLTPDYKKKDTRKKHKAKFEKMHDEYLSDIRNMTCTNEQIAGDHAVVTAETKEDKRLIPFVQSQGQWKFDMRTYRAFYGVEKDKKSMKQKSM